MRVSARERIYYNWQYAWVTAGMFQLAMTPLVWNIWSSLLLTVFLQLPAYLFHQVEECYGNRFRTFMNREFGRGREVLTWDAVLVINIVGVWGVDLAALYLCFFARPGLGLIAANLALVNGVVHIHATVIKRVYHPGLETAVLLLLPAGSLCWWQIVRVNGATLADHLWGLGVALAVHVLIVVHLVRRLRTMSRGSS